MLVSDYMTPHPLTVPAETPVEEAADLLKRHQIHQLPVVDETEHLVGILTDRDIRSAVGSDDDMLLRLVASEIMTTDVVSVTPNDDIRLALEILCRQRFGGLPVLKDDAVVGIITTRDMLRCLRDQFDMPAIMPEAKVSRAHADTF
jgi:acetoin utilization protein AcuB